MIADEGSAEELDEAAVVRFAESGEARGEVRGVAEKSVLEDDDVLAS